MKHLLHPYFHAPLRAAILCIALPAVCRTADSYFRLAPPPADSPHNPSLHLYPVCVDAAAACGIYRIVVAAGGEWLADTSGECTLLPRGGDSDTREMTVTLPPDESCEERALVKVCVAGAGESGSRLCESRPYGFASGPDGRFRGEFPAAARTGKEYECDVSP